MPSTKPLARMPNIGDVQISAPLHQRTLRTQHSADQIGIYRAFCRSRGGYYAHVTLHRNGKIFQRDFFEKRCGGEQEARKLAQAWRDTIIAKHPPMSMMEFCSILRTNNTSGVAGVSRCEKRNVGKNGIASTRHYWRAHIPLADGKSRLEYFSVRTFGEDDAKERAIAARLQGLSQLQTIVFRAARQPQPVNNKAAIALLEAKLRAPSERRLRQAAQLEAKRLQTEQRAARKIADALETETLALDTPTNRSGEPYIGRYTIPSGTSSYWRVSIIRAGTRHRKTFTDSVYGGADSALAAAKSWRDQLFCTLPVDSKATAVSRLKATNTSGAAGVTRVRKMRNGEIFHYWMAFRPKIKGQPGRRKHFAISKFGDDQAFALAVKARADFLAELCEVGNLHLSVLTRVDGPVFT